MFRPNDPDSIKRLRAACKQSVKEMEPSQKNRMTAWREFVGKHGAAHGTRDKRPINLLELAATIFKQNLVSSCPQAGITPRYQQQAASAASFELAINQILKQDGVATELELWVEESLFSPQGVLKLTLDVRDAVEIDGQQIWTGPPRIEAITGDNWMQDMSAGSPHRVAFCGDKYTVDKDWAMQCGLYDPEIVALGDKDSSGPTDTDSESLNRSRRYYEDYRDMLELWDVWLPEEGLLLTFHGNFEHEPLRIVEWSGPKSGPYRRLFYDPIPGNSLPAPPVAFWIDLHDLVNRLWNKLARQAERQKTVDVFQSGDEKFAADVKDAVDGSILTATQLGDHETVTTGGINNTTFAFVLQTKQLFSYLAGNLDALGGLAPMSGTLGQDELLTQGASQRVRHMQSRVREALRGVFRDLGEYLWANDLIDIPIMKQVAGMQIPGVWNREGMEGEFPDYLIDINPYSLQELSPSERLAQLQAFWRMDVLPALPVLQAQGIMPSVQGYVNLVAKYANLPELPQLLMQMDATPLPAGEPPAKPNTTVRHNVRSNRSERTPGGGEVDMINRLLGGGMNAGGGMNMDAA